MTEVAGGLAGQRLGPGGLTGRGVDEAEPGGEALGVHAPAAELALRAGARVFATVAGLAWPRLGGL